MLLKIANVRFGLVFWVKERRIINLIVPYLLIKRIFSINTRRAV